MTQVLRQSTQIKVVIGPVVAVGDGFTPVTTLSVATADEAEILKSDAASVTDISGATFAAITSADGYYNLTLTTSHTDTVGLLTVLINDDSLCLPVKATFQVVEEAIYDALYAASATGLLPANVTQWLGSAAATPTVAGVPEVDVTHWLGTAAATPTVAGVPEVDVTHYGGSAGTFASGRPEVNASHWLGTAIATPDTAGYPKVTIKNGIGTGEISLTAGSVASVAEVDDFTANAQTTIQSVVNAALVAQRLDELLNADSDIDGAAPPTVGSVFHELMSKTAGSFTFDQTTDSLEAVRDNVGTAGAGLTNIGTIATVTTLTNLPAITSNWLTAAGLATDAVNEIVDQVWREAIADHSGTAGSTAEALAAAGGAGDPWITPLPGSYTSGQAGYIVGNYLTAALTSLRTNTAQSGTSSTIVLDASANANDDYYKFCLIKIISGTGAGQSRIISAYTGSTKTATVARNWTTNPASDSVFAILANDGAAQSGDTYALASGASGFVTLAGALSNVLLDTNELQTDWANGGRLDSIVDAILDDTGTSGVVTTSAERNAIADALLDRSNGIETGVTPRAAWRRIGATVAGKVSGAGTGVETFLGLDGLTTRVTVTVDSSGNRTSITYA